MVGMSYRDPTTKQLVKIPTGCAGGGAPVGFVGPYMGSVAPVGWVICDGRAHNSPALQTLLGSGNTPDLRGRFILAASATHAAKTSGGEETHTLTVDEIPAHDHTGTTAAEGQEHTHGIAGSVAQSGHLYTTDAGWNTPGAAAVEAANANGSLTPHTHGAATGGRSATHTHSLTAQGGGGAHNNMPPYYAMVYIIKAFAESANGGITQADADARYLSPAEVLAGNNITVDTSTTPGSVIIASTASGGGGSVSKAGYLLFSEMTGSTDDAKLADAVSKVSAMTYKPTVILDENRLYTFNNAHPDPPHGWHLSGPLGSFASNIEQGSKNSLNAKVKINYNGTWINPSVTKWNLQFSNINFEGTSNTVWLNSSTQTLWCMHLSSLSFNLFKHVIGTTANKCLMTACQIDGYWDVANSYDTAFHIGGSDSNLWLDGMLLDSGIQPSSARPHMHLDYLGKTVIGPIYCTNIDLWTGLRVTGSSANGPGLVFLPGSRWEGKNESADEAANTHTISVEGGSLYLVGAYTSFGNKTLVTNGSTIKHTGGHLEVHACSYSRADGVGQDVPYIYSSGGELVVSGIVKATQGGSTWTDQPVVSVAGTSKLLYSDASVRVTPQKQKIVRVFSDAIAPDNPQVGDLHFS